MVCCNHRNDNLEYQKQKDTEDQDDRNRIMYERKQLLDRLTKEYKRCMDGAEDTYITWWENECRHKGLPQRCSLPNADVLDARFRNDQLRCKINYDMKAQE